MTDRITALRALERAVKAGDAAPKNFNSVWDQFGPEWPIGHKAALADEGSLDAAKALHEALLPGWVARPQIGGAGAGVTVWHCTIEDWDSGEEISANNLPCPARAWLLAIIRALIAKEGGE